ncbi:MAG TPA: hypothetical protein VG734_22920 [Lacunisphaera sp.]|nr:hypothetical protein [Lacunisphaera sp.]
MKPLLALFLTLVASAAPSIAEDYDEAHRFIFFSVLEGCFEDGLATQDVAQILLKGPNDEYCHFIYSCLLCGPTIHALEVYRSRPATFFALKGGTSTPGSLGTGLKPHLKKMLYSEQPAERLAAINILLQRWFAHRMSCLALSDGQREKLQKAIEAKRKYGMRQLAGFKGRTFDRGPYAGMPEVLFYAPAYATLDECAVCNAACGRQLKTSDPH